MSSEITRLHANAMCNISRVVQELTNWIETGIHQSLSVKDIVMRFGYSKCYLQCTLQNCNR